MCCALVKKENKNKKIQTTACVLLFSNNNLCGIFLEKSIPFYFVLP